MWRWIFLLLLVSCTPDSVIVKEKSFDPPGEYAVPTELICPNGNRVLSPKDCYPEPKKSDSDLIPSNDKIRRSCEQLKCSRDALFVANKVSNHYMYCHCKEAKDIDPYEMRCFRDESSAIARGFTLAPYCDEGKLANQETTKLGNAQQFGYFT